MANPRAVIEVDSDDSDEPSSSSCSDAEIRVLQARPTVTESSIEEDIPQVARKALATRPRSKRTLGPDDEIVSIKDKFKTPELGITYSVKIKGQSGLQRVSADDLFEYPDLVEQYERKQRGSHNISSSSDEDEQDNDQQEEEEGEWDEDAPQEFETEEEEEDQKPSTKRSARSRPRRPTPPSPPKPTRRSNRSTRNSNRDYGLSPALDAEQESDATSEDINIQPVRRHHLNNSGRRTLASPKRLKKYTDLNDSENEDDSEEDNEEELESTQLHRSECEKCHLRSAGEIWDIMHQVKRRRRKDEIDDGEIEALGCWVECQHCPVAYHFACLPKNVQRNIVRTLNAQEQESWKLEDNPKDLKVLEQSTEVHGMPTVIRESEDEADDKTLDEKPRSMPEGEQVNKRDKPKIDCRRIRLHKKEEDIYETLTLDECPFCARPTGTTCFKCHHVLEPSKRAKEPTKQDSQQALTQEDKKATAPELIGETKSFETQNEKPEEAAEVKDVDISAEAESKKDKDGDDGHLLFRCTTCHRSAHYVCMPLPPTDDDTSNASSDIEMNGTAGPKERLQETAQYYQSDWRCDDCDRWTAKPDVILAWRPLDYASLTAEQIQQAPRPAAKDALADAEYFVKWQGMSYRLAEWVPHAFLAATSNARLRNFLDKGSELRDAAAEESKVNEDEGEGQGTLVDLNKFGRAPNVTADKDIPQDWLTIERVINCTFKSNNENGFSTAENTKKISQNPKQSIGRVYQALIKWQSLPYSECTWEAFDEDDKDWGSFVEAYSVWLWQKDVVIPTVSPAALRSLDQARKKSAFKALTEQPSYMRGTRSLKLMEFQLEGVSWLYYKWWIKQGGILSDEMGLGKTVQVISFLSLLFVKEECQPFLVVVPNSTIGNWVREFATWGPSGLKVVPYFGSTASRRTIKENELFPSTGLHAHVVICTYESITNDIPLFKAVQRWDTLIVDEAQRLKGGDTGHLFKALRSLNIGNRFLLTGTPLNNSVSEIFNLMAFIDPESFPDLRAEQDKYENLTPELVKELRERLEPYFLRRTKEQVLSLPPLGEVIVPVSLRPLQKQIYKSILAKNIESIESLYRGGKGGGQGKKASFLIQLRQCCQSPYLNAPDIEPLDVTPEQSLQNMIDASGKLTFLAKLIPKLIDGGHRLLVFSQFLGTLDILNRFLEGMDIPYVTLSGSSTQGERQEAIDSFNAPDSPKKVFTLTTRAGGVGINLTTADTVILFDQDFNPMADLQAVSRAHRIGQTKPVTCFKLMIKGSCEEKILAAGKKKLVLEHLIVSRLNTDERESEEIESVLQFGAKELFEQGEGESANDIKYTDADIDSLLEQSRKAVEDAAKAKDSSTENKAFSYAKVWEKNGGLHELAEEEETGANAEEQRGFWGAVLAQQRAEQIEKERQKALGMGRGRRQRKPVRNLDGELGLDVVDIKSSPKPQDDNTGGDLTKDAKKKRRRSAKTTEDEDFVDDPARSVSPSSEAHEHAPDHDALSNDLEGLYLPLKKTGKRRKIYTPPAEGPSLPSGPPISPNRPVSSTERKQHAPTWHMPREPLSHARYVTQPPTRSGSHLQQYSMFNVPAAETSANHPQTQQHQSRKQKRPSYTESAPPKKLPRVPPGPIGLESLSREDKERYFRQSERLRHLRAKVHRAGAYHLNKWLEEVESSFNTNLRHDNLAFCKQQLRLYQQSSPFHAPNPSSNGNAQMMFG